MSKENTARKPKATTTRSIRTRGDAPVVVEGGPKHKPFLKQGTTWAGIFSIAAAVATGGASVLVDPLLLSQIGAGIALLIAEN